MSSHESLLEKFLSPSSSLSQPFEPFPTEYQEENAHDIVLSDSDSYRESSDYGTDDTTPPSSNHGDDQDNEEVEALRDSEYPQMQAGVYLDHGGATVSLPSELIPNLPG